MSENSIFFSLPLEIRRTIYSHLLGGWHHVTTPSLEARSSAFCDRHVLRPFCHQSIWSQTPYLFPEKRLPTHRTLGETFRPKFVPDYNILCVNRQSHDEASEFLYGTASFAFFYETADLAEPGVDDSLTRGLEEKLSRLQRVLIDFRETDIVSDDIYDELSVCGIKDRLNYLRTRLSPLRQLEIHFSFRGTCHANGDIPGPIDLLMEDTEMADIISGFEAKEFKISLDYYYRSLHVDAFQSWVMNMADLKDLEVYKYAAFCDRIQTVHWTVRPRDDSMRDEGREQKGEEDWRGGGRIVLYTEVNINDPEELFR